VGVTLTNIAQAEAATYRQVWAVPAYRVKCHSLDLWRQRRDLFPDEVTSAIDLGCGTGRLVSAWGAEGIDGYGVDLVPDASLDPEVDRARVYTAPLWDFRPGRVFDVGVAADVMEHIPELYLDEALARIRECCRWVVFRNANIRSVVNGIDLHPIKQDADWWESRTRRIMRGFVEVLPSDAVRRYVLRWRAIG